MPAKRPDTKTIRLPVELIRTAVDTYLFALDEPPASDREAVEAAIRAASVASTKNTAATFNAAHSAALLELGKRLAPRAVIGWDGTTWTLYVELDGERVGIGCGRGDPVAVKALLRERGIDLEQHPYGSPT